VGTTWPAGAGEVGAEEEGLTLGGHGEHAVAGGAGDVDVVVGDLGEVGPGVLERVVEEVAGDEADRPLRLVSSAPWAIGAHRDATRPGHPTMGDRDGSRGGVVTREGVVISRPCGASRPPPRRERRSW